MFLVKSLDNEGNFPRKYRKLLSAQPCSWRLLVQSNCANFSYDHPHLQDVSSIHQAAMAPPPIVRLLLVSYKLILTGVTDTLTPPLPHVQPVQFDPKASLITTVPAELYATIIFPSVRLSASIQFQLYAKAHERQCHACDAVLFATLKTAARPTWSGSQEQGRH